MATPGNDKCCFSSQGCDPIRVVVTGAAGNIAYSLLYMIAKGDVFGATQPIILHLLDIPHMMGVVQGVVMELEDCALPLLCGIIATADVFVAFEGVEAAFLVGAMPRKQGMERRDLLAANVAIFKTQGEALDKCAHKSVKVLVVGNPANTNALICAKYAPSIARTNFTAMTRLDQNRAQAQLARKVCVDVAAVANVIIWGNHSSTQFPDAAHATVLVQNGAKVVAAPDAVLDDNWLRGEFVETVQKRGATVINTRKMSSAMSAAKAAADHMRDWVQGTSGTAIAPNNISNQHVSMGVWSEGWYGAPKDVIFSFPVKISKGGQWQVVESLEMSDFAKNMLESTGQELVQEREEALNIIQQQA